MSTKSTPNKSLKDAVADLLDVVDEYRRDHTRRGGCECSACHSRLFILKSLERRGIIEQCLDTSTPNP